MKRHSSSFVIAAICAGAATIAFATDVQSQQARPRPFVLAAASVRDDHRLTMLEVIARFTGTEWVNTWPPADDHKSPLPTLAEVPADWLGIPVPRKWAVSFDRTHRVSVSVDHMERLLGCTNLIVLGLNHATGDPAGVVDSDRINIAVDTPSQTVEGFRKLGVGDVEWHSRATTILATYRAHVTTIVRTMGNPDWAREALQGVELSTVPIKISYLYQQLARGPAVTYLFEAKQESSRPDGRLIGVLVRGWLRVDAKGNASTFGLTDGAHDEEGMSSVQPMAWFQLGVRTYWLLRITGYEDYRFSIMEITPTDARQVLSAGGGGC